MKRYYHFISVLTGLVSLLAVTSCVEELFDENLSGTQYEVGKMVELTIPFSVSEGIKTEITTKGSTDTDSHLSGIMVFVYENKPGETDMSQNKRLAWYLFSNPAQGSLDNSIGGWTEGTDKNTGTIKFFVPTGPCYIYLIGNALGSFLNFFPGMPTADNSLENLQKFWDAGTPEWTGNMNTVDGYLPMVGTVNNSSGACEVFVDENDGKVKIKYKKDDETEVEFDPNITETPSTPSDDESFVLKRLMSKVTVNIKSGTNGTFIPKDYKFYNVSKHVAPTESARWPNYRDSILIKMTDTESIPFSTQSPNSFTVYLPENIERNSTGVTTFAGREAVKKNENGEIEVHENGHYIFENAPKLATYMEITGRFEGTHDGVQVSADTRYLIHFGDFGNDMNDFNLRRDHHYTYNITVNGVEDIYVEVNSADADKDAPGAESIIFEGGARVQLDAHYEQVEMKLEKSKMENGAYIFARTPFGDLNCLYRPSSDMSQPGTIENAYIYNQDGSSVTTSEEDVKSLLSWISFRRQNSKGELAPYYASGPPANVFDALDEFYSSGSAEAYYTCFVDEYYYEKHPNPRLAEKVELSLNDFINAKDRVFCVGTGIQYSKDRKSAVAKAVYMLQQHSIACFYDLNNNDVAKYGVEVIDETGDLANKKLQYGNPDKEGTSDKDGRMNTLNETGSKNDQVNWSKNGFLLDENGNLKAGTERLKTNSAYLACLTRNRDFNGDNLIDERELRWYIPARDQMLGLWIGEPALPAKAALYPKSTENLTRPTDESQSIHPIFTSTESSRVIWAEEGCSFGNIDAAKQGGYIRAVRNLGKTPSGDSHTIPAGEYYHYNSSDRTIDVFLTNNALRAFSNRELAPHHERSTINRPYRKFQVARNPYVIENVKAECLDDGILYNPETRNYTQLQTLNSVEAKTGNTTIASKYKEEGDNSNAAWRLPNQREMALMIVAIGPELGYDNSGNQYHHMDYHCEGHSIFSPRHDWEYINNYVLHCRTSFSSKAYAEHGFMYNVRDKKMQMLWTSDKGDIGQGLDGLGGCICVRDVQ